MNPRHKLGSRGEALAASFLRGRGLTLVARNYCCQAGEIDIVAMDGQMLVFVEVRSKSSDELSTPEESVGPEKRRQLMRLARIFQEQTACHALPCRFDVVSVVGPSEGEPRIDHFPDAFGLVPLPAGQRR